MGQIKKFKSRVFIGRHIVWHFIRRIFKRPVSGLQAFLDNYHDDKLASVDAATRRLMPEFSRCHVCKLCDTVCPRLADDPKALAPSYIVAAFSRSLPDYAYFDADSFDCRSCNECEKTCPQSVPLRTLADFMKTQSDWLRKIPGNAPKP